MKKKLSIVGGALLVILAAFVVSNGINESTTSNRPNSASIRIDTSAEFEPFLEIDFKSDEMTAANGAVLLRYERFYPALTENATEAFRQVVSSYYDAVSVAAEDYLQGEAYQNALERWQESKGDFSESTYRTYASVQYENAGMVCVYRNVEESKDGATQSLQNFSETFNKKDGTIILLSDMFIDTDALVQKIIENKTRYQALTYDFLEDVDTRLMEEFEPNQFYLDEGYLYVFYNTGDIATEEQGAPYFKIPHQEFINMYRSGFQFLGK